jgi:hypothetical protein
LLERVPRVGILFVGSLDADRHQGFVTAMQQLGYREGATINYELRNTAVDQLPGVVRDLIALMRYRASKFDCDACGLKQRCTPNMPARKILRSIHEGRARSARDLALTDAYLTSRRERKKVEMLFAHLKRILKLDRLRLRGPNGAKDEFLLAATAQNLRKLAKLIPIPQPEPA